VGWALLGWKKREKQEERELGCSGSKEERAPRPDWAERRQTKWVRVYYKNHMRQRINYFRVYKIVLISETWMI
jgi:hypothetical protein